MEKVVFLIFIMGIINCQVLTLKMPINNQTKSAKEIMWDRLKQQPKIINTTEKLSKTYAIKDDNEAEKLDRSKRSPPTIYDCILPRVPSEEMTKPAYKCFTFEFRTFPEIYGDEIIEVGYKRVSFIYPTPNINITYACETGHRGEPLYCEYRTQVINKRIYRYKKEIDKAENRILRESCVRDRFTTDYDY